MVVAGGDVLRGKERHLRFVRFLAEDKCACVGRVRRGRGRHCGVLEDVHRPSTVHWGHSQVMTTTWKTGKKK